MSKICMLYHSVDMDGWMSAAIVKHWFKDRFQMNGLREQCDSSKDTLEFIGYNYGQPIPDLSGYDKVIMCDISFPKDEMIKLWDTVGVENMIWIDHHISAIKEIQDTKWLWEGQQDTKFAACELTWKYFFPNETMPEIVRLLGLYDSFRHKGTDEETKVLEFQYGARQVITNYEEAYKYLTIELNSYLPNPNNYDREENPIYKIWNNGKSIYQYLCTEAKQTYKNGFEIEFLKYSSLKENSITVVNPETLRSEIVYNHYHKFICINKERFNPINFGIDYHKDGYDGAACFHYANGMWNFSIYNDNGLVDCSLIAKQYGGGGHFSASGFICNNETFLKIINNGRNLERRKRV